MSETACDTLLPLRFRDGGELPRPVGQVLVDPVGGKRGSVGNVGRERTRVSSTGSRLALDPFCQPDALPLRGDQLANPALGTKADLGRVTFEFDGLLQRPPQRRT